ncbi:MAG: thioredoxin-disulfide reductase [Pseudorhodoplanes sp.]|uniref:thioredoxin-disulfide reductase n=1 Tax=Pseudorhodoplanes sp. TaxID=1934341 RepID=UPI003D146239
MSETIRTKFLIIGGGPAGYTAAIYGARANLQPILLRGDQPGGQLSITTDVENYPGFSDVVQGPWLVAEMEKQAEHAGASILQDTIMSLDLSARPFLAIGENGSYAADAIAICTGARARWLGLQSEEFFRGCGVSACATCDGFFFRNKDVVVVGGGNTATEEALYLSRLAKSVTLVHRGDRLRSEKVLQQKLFDNPKIRVIWSHVVEEILGDHAPRKVTGLRLRDQTSHVEQLLAADGVFVAIGHDPATGPFRDTVACDPGGYIKTRPGSAVTSVPGVFAAGDVVDYTYRQAVTAAGMGCMAALDAERFLSDQQP